jgi:hypothetical protein
LAASLVLTGILPLSATPQSARGLEKGKGHNRREANRYYDQGLRDGRQDAERRRDHRYHAHPGRDVDRRAYQDGYDTGFREVMASRGRDRDYRDRDRNPRGFGAGSSGTLGGLAAQNGQQDGLNDGRRDRATGHSFRPTEGDNYKHADRGYYSQLGSRDQYKQEYRQAYVRAYQQGYGR